jgi:hypothetical protein
VSTCYLRDRTVSASERMRVPLKQFVRVALRDLAADALAGRPMSERLLPGKRLLEEFRKRFEADRPSTVESLEIAEEQAAGRSDLTRCFVGLRKGLR